MFQRAAGDGATNRASPRESGPTTRSRGSGKEALTRLILGREQTRFNRLEGEGRNQADPPGEGGSCKVQMQQHFECWSPSRTAASCPGMAYECAGVRLVLKRELQKALESEPACE